MLDFSEAHYQAVNYIVDKMWKTSSHIFFSNGVFYVLLRHKQK